MFTKGGAFLKSSQMVSATAVSLELSLEILQKGIVPFSLTEARLIHISPDLLGVSDEEVWEYGEAVRQLAHDNNCTHIRFARIRDLLGMSSNTKEGKERYLERVSEYRKQLTRANIAEDFDVSALIASDPDTAMTYRGYVKFLEKDLEFTDAYERNVSSSQIKKRNERVAKQMIGRGKVSPLFSGIFAIEPTNM